MKVAVVSFPGSNCDQDTVWALESLGVEVVPVWYTAPDVGSVDRVVLPGGFSYGDYLRSGALAAEAPVMDGIARRVENDRLPVLGICNGFQILTERGLLPGVLRTNPDGKFRCGWETVKVVSENPLFPGIPAGTRWRLPIAHREGSYWATPEDLERLRQTGGLLFQYTDEEGRPTPEANPNGSIENIAGVAQGSVVGLMPHPERAMAVYLGSSDGQHFLRAWLGGQRG